MASGIRKIRSCLKAAGRWLSSLRFGHQIGLVVLERSVRLCLLKRRFWRSRVVEVTAFPLAEDSCRDWAGRIRAAVRIVIGYLQNRKLAPPPVNVGLLNEDIAFRRMYLPAMPRREIAAAVMFEGEKLFPFNFSHCRVAYEEVDRRTINRFEQIGINITAVKHDLIDIVYDSFTSAGLTVGNVDYLPGFMASSSLTRADGRGWERFLVVNLDDDQSMAVFVHNNRLEFFQQFITPPTASPENDLILTNGRALAAELNSFLDLYRGQNPGGSIEAILLCGRFGNDLETAAVLAEATGLPCNSFFADGALPPTIEGIDRDRASRLLDAIQVALAPSSLHPLVPPAVRAREEKRRVIIRAGAAAVIAVMVVGGLSYEKYKTGHRLSNDLDERKVLTANVERSPGYQGYLNLTRRLGRRMAILSGDADKHQSHCHVLLKELSLVAPDHLHLTSIDLSDEHGAYTLRLDGNVRLRGFSPEIVLARYVETLENSPFFQNVAVTRHSKTREGDRFDLVFQLKMDARV